MPEVKARLRQLASIEEAAKNALELADQCSELLIGIKADECLQTVRQRIVEISHHGRI
ncbi:hypothetical protein [Sphingomonas faeni]|uniref:hypothetical protein n=1 Tax=Sphingomonas faeni TaxID=185950 RepID=UPI0033554550